MDIIKWVQEQAAKLPKPECYIVTVWLLLLVPLWKLSQKCSGLASSTLAPVAVYTLLTLVASLATLVSLLRRILRPKVLRFGVLWDMKTMTPYCPASSCNSPLSFPDPTVPAPRETLYCVACDKKLSLQDDAGNYVTLGEAKNKIKGRISVKISS